MTERRQLNDDERRVASNALSNLKADLAYAEYLVKDASLLLDTGLELSYQRKRKEYEGKLRGATEQCENLRTVIQITEDQLTNGVVPIEPAEEETTPAADVGTEITQ